jgi:hypothetical protein
MCLCKLGFAASGECCESYNPLVLWCARGVCVCVLEQESWCGGLRRVKGAEEGKAVPVCEESYEMAVREHSEIVWESLNCK